MGNNSFDDTADIDFDDFTDEELALLNDNYAKINKAKTSSSVKKRNKKFKDIKKY